MKVGIEATHAVESQKTGVGYYAFHVIRAMLSLQGLPHSYSIYVRHNHSERFGRPADSASRISMKVLSSPYFWAQIRLPLELWTHPQDVYFFPSSVVPLTYQPANSVVTVHDVAFLFFQDHFSPLLRRWLTIATERSVRKARKVIAVSEATRQDVLIYYGIEPEKVVTIHHGVHERFTPCQPEIVEVIKKKYSLNRPYIICVGTLQRRKNIPRLLHAFYLLKQKYHLPHILVLAGQKCPDLPENDIFATLERLSLKHDVIWTGYAGSEDLPPLLTGAELFVLPSLYEGFGMPVLEAMACGIPVACSNTSSLPEVLGEAGITFDPYSVEHISETIHHILTHHELRMELREKGLARSTHFSWQRCARQTLDILESVGKS
ncbi:hypothetical protein CSA56_05015 [candidate division KSB3 bacterium]|uniref:Glycosyl transferase family 1 n=1 Tax=candidate division KSB3 bacterium TaxID=2044937 RepID=A0A2G6KK98_9BACT|nr:MAG: hypothetical protein CSA56_05015 [candidate division KSB3 bacterium]